MELERPFATLGDYQIVKFLGGDNVSKVKLGQDPNTNTVHAIKIIKKDQIDGNKEVAIEKEVNTISLLDHPNIIKFQAVNWDATYNKKNNTSYQTIAFTMEYAERGNLYEYLDQTGAFSEDVVRTYFQQLIEAVEYCHSQNITHRNLKLDNLLLDSHFKLKVSGFGLSALLSGQWNSYLLTTRVGNETYMAPEMYQHEVYNGAQVDVFACGVILFALLSRKAPFDKADKKTNILYKLLAEKSYPKFWAVQEKDLEKMGVMQKYSDEFKDLIQGMLANDPAERLTIEDIKTHAWYTKGTAPLICLVSELEGKLKIVQETHEAKELEKQKLKELGAQIKALAQTSNQAGGLGNFTGYRPFRSGGDVENGEQEKAAEEQIDFGLKRKLASFNLDTLPKTRTQIFITSDVKSVFTSLYLACKAELNDFSVSKSNYKIKGRVVKDKGSCKLEVTVSQVEEGSLCVEFFKQNGDMILFYKVIDKIKSRLPIAAVEEKTETKAEK